MNVVVIAVTVWLVLAWVGLVFLIAKMGRNRRLNHPRPLPSTGHGVTAVPATGAPPDIRGKLPTTGPGWGRRHR